jgi:hypothetical protein
VTGRSVHVVAREQVIRRRVRPPVVWDAAGGEEFCRQYGMRGRMQDGVLGGRLGQARGQARVEAARESHERATTGGRSG